MDQVTLLQIALAKLPAESMELRHALVQVVPKIRAIMKAWEHGIKEPAVEQIVLLCSNADLAFKKRFRGEMQGFTRKVVQRRVWTRSMHTMWLRE